MNITKSELIKLLIEDIYTIKFTKVDGTVRDMNCTLKESILPKLEEPTTRKKKPNDNVLPVWDLDNKQWRSFRVDSIISYTVSGI
jgi:hypothetical protein